MTQLVRMATWTLGFLVLGSFALPLVGCGKDSTDQDGTSGRLDSGSAQGDSGASTGTGGVAGGSGGSGAGGAGPTGYECSAGGGASGTAGGTTVPRTCYPYATGSFYCSAHLCGCNYNPVTGCLCADATVSPCGPIDPKCTASTAGGTTGIGLDTVNPSKNVSCYCDMNGYWWCSQ
jgi:hypothetical protein